MWQAISQAGGRQTQKLHVVMPAGGIKLLQRFAGVRFCRVHCFHWAQGFSFREPLLYVLPMIEGFARVFWGFDLVRKRQGKWGDMREMGLRGGDARATLYG